MATSRREQQRRGCRRDELVARWRTWACRPIQWALGLGAGTDRDPRLVDERKRIRLCNLLALWGGAIMTAWVVVEALFGQSGNLVWELGFLACFPLVLALDGGRAHRAARLLLLAAANACVFAGALMFDRAAGGTLPFFALIGLPLLLFGPRQTRMVILGAGLSALLFATCETGEAARWLGVHPRAAPGWYFGANAASAFAAAFVVPFFFCRSNIRAEASLERIGREKLQRVIDSDLIGVVRGRLCGRIEEANDTFLDLLGYTRQDLAIGALDLKAIAPVDPGGAQCPMAADGAPPRGMRSVYERTFRRKDGVLIPALVGVALLDESHDEVVGFVLDLTAQKHLAAQEAMLRESREALRLRDLFNSIASHELKTPLTGLMLNLQMLRRRLDREVPASAALRTQVDRCECSASRMGDLIHALLDVSQMHDGKLRLCVHEMDMVEAVRRIVSGFEVDKAGTMVPRIQVEANEAVTAQVDSLRFDQVLTNLLSNAVKYGAGKPIDVRVGHDRVADVARLEVIDRGAGIEPEMTQKIFEPFQRAVSAAETIPGLGLGLYVVKMIVEGHGGRINVESRPGAGSRFIVDLPCANARC